MAVDQNLKSNNRANNRFILLLVLAFVSILGLLFLLTKTPLTKLIATDENENEFLALSTEEAFLLSEGEAEQLYPFNGDHVIKVTNEMVSYLNFQGKSENSISIKSQSPVTEINENYILVADQGGYNFYLFDANGLVYQGSTSAPIESAALSDSGKTAFLMDEIHTKGVLRVLDESGQHMLDWRVRDRIRSGYIVSMAFTESSDSIDVSLLNTDGANLTPMLSRIDLQQATISSTTVIEGNSVYPIVIPVSDIQPLLVDSQTVLKFEEQRIIPWLTFQTIQAIDKDENGVALLASPLQGESPSLYFFGFDQVGNTDRGVAGSGSVLGEDLYDLESGFGLLSVAHENGVFILRQNTINEHEFHECGSRIIRQKFLSPNHLLLICEDSVQIIRV